MNLETLSLELSSSKKTWLVTGCAGFIGSHLLEFLLRSNQNVVGVDNFLTGSQFNLDDVEKCVKAEQWRNFKFINGDIIQREVTDEVTRGVDYVLHQAALGAVPRSIKAPLDSHDNNVTGTANLFWSCHSNGVKKVVYASSSSVYGDNENLPKLESQTGNPLSPYAATKAIVNSTPTTFIEFMV
ncbi:MAG: NAD-dependent epimerase/dehydratase family protein [Bdellovibrionales bacterium]